MSRRKSKAPAAPRVLDPLRGCKFCKGFGWVDNVTAQTITRDVPGLKPEIQGRPTVRRCSCTIPERRDQVVAPELPPAELDGVQRRAGERSE